MEKRQKLLQIDLDIEEIVHLNAQKVVAGIVEIHVLVMHNHLLLDGMKNLQ